MTGPAEALSAPALPGRRFYAPQARIVSEDGSPILVSGRPITADLVSARVTQTHHGISQVSLTLNNQRHEEHNEHRPLVPSWKYNGLSAIEFGQTVRVQYRYGSDEEDWHPMILARINDVGFSFPSSGGARLTLQGEDQVSLLKKKPPESKTYNDKQELEIVRDAVSRSGSGLTLAPPPSPVTFQESLRTVTHQNSVTFQQFIESLAERLDYEAFVDFDDPTDKNSAVRYHFRPSRSTDLRGVIDLTWNRDLVDFTPKFKVWEVYTRATASGRNPRRRARAVESVEASDLTMDLHPAPGGAAPISALQARDRYFPGESNKNELNIAVTNLDAARARQAAVAGLRKQARQFLTAEATTIGFTRLRPGIHVNIKGMYAPFDGIYYVTQAVHTLDSGGYITRCSLRRPGMLDSSDYPGG